MVRAMVWWCDVVLSLNRVWFVCSDDSTYFSLMCMCMDLVSSFSLCLGRVWVSILSSSIHSSFCWFIIPFNFSHLSVYIFFFALIVFLGATTTVAARNALKRTNCFPTYAWHILTPFGFFFQFYLLFFFLFVFADYLLLSFKRFRRCRRSQRSLC